MVRPRRRPSLQELIPDWPQLIEAVKVKVRSKHHQVYGKIYGCVVITVQETNNLPT